MNKAFWGDKREDFFRALISLTESEKILWDCSDSTTALDESRHDTQFHASYQKNQLFLSSNDGKPRIVITSDDGEQAEIGNETDTLVLKLYDLVYNRQFPSIKHIMDDIIAEAETLSHEESTPHTCSGM